MTRDLVGVAMERGDRVWLVRPTPDGVARVCAGVVVDPYDDGSVLWIDDLMSDADWARECFGCDLTSRGFYAPPRRPGGDWRVSQGRELKVMSARPFASRPCRETQTERGSE